MSGSHQPDSGDKSSSSSKLWFILEIQHMMHGFGDCRRPLAESAALIEQIVYQQMKTILSLAEEIARQREARNIGIEDFLFLLRHDKVKLRRLLRYLQLKDLKMSAVKGAAVDDADETSEADLRANMKKRYKICYDFLNTIDQTGELVALLDDTGEDEIKHERMLRAEMQSRYMDTHQYLQFCESRQISFTPRYKTQKFRDWLLSNQSLDFKPNPLAIEVLSYLAFETVAQIVDMALLVRRDHNARPDDAFSRQMAPVCFGHDAWTTPTIPQPQDSLSAGNSLSLSPPGTPVAGGMSSYVDSTTSTSYSTNQTGKDKKRKRPGTQQSRDLISAQAITVSDIREAMRRYNQPHGPFFHFMKLPFRSSSHRLLCC